MKLNKTLWLLPALIIFGLLLLGWKSYSRSQPQSTPRPSATTSAISAPSSPTPSPVYQTIRASDIVSGPAAYNYSVEIPAGWKVEVVKETEALNIYNPLAPGTNNLEKSQIFIRYFKANSFLTLQTVNILERTEMTIQNRPAVRYLIEKKATVANFVNQPSWRSQKHIVTDIRGSDNNPSIFYVVAKRPDLDEQIYQHFFDSLDL